MLLMAGPENLKRMTFNSFSFKIAGKAAVNTYGFLHHAIVSKIFPGQQYNSSVHEVMRPLGLTVRS
jgi:hypothetical protein